MSEKTLPSDDSDYSLPGRLEESSPPAPPVEPRPKSRGLVIGGIIFVVVAAGFFSYYFVNQDSIDSEIMGNTVQSAEQRLISQYNVGEIGSDHAHAAIALFIDDDVVDFGAQKFQLKSRYIHFENHNPYMVHKHATNAPLEILFASIGLNITPECIRTNAGQEFCADSENTLTFMVNGMYHSDIAGHEIKHGDRILISYGSQDDVAEQAMYLESFEIYDVPEQNVLVPGRDFSV